MPLSLLCVSQKKIKLGAAVPQCKKKKKITENWQLASVFGLMLFNSHWKLELVSSDDEVSNALFMPVGSVRIAAGRKRSRLRRIGPVSTMLRFLLLHLPLLAQSAPVVSDRTSLAIGQDRDSVISYMRTFGQPAAQYAVMSYTSLANLTGLWTPIDYGSGVEHAAALLDAFPSADLQLGLYIAHTLDEIGNGNMDTQIDKLAEFCRAYATRTFYIRVGYECDGPHNQHKPEPYKVAFRRISQKLKAQTTNVRIVWHSWASNQPNFMNLPTSVWWPGSDVVDWIGVSLFEQVYLGYAGLTAADAVAFWARSNQSKPVMIAESTPKGLGVNPKLVDRDNVWQSWFEPVLMFIERHDIAMWSYINCDWEEQPMWKGGGWGDTRLEVGDQLSMHWQAQVLVQERFARAGYPSKATQIGKQSLTQSSARRLLLILLAATLAAF
eukprot:g6779.t1